MPFSYGCVEKHINLAEHGQQTGAKRLPPGCGEGETFPCYCSAGHSNRMLITSCKLPPSAGLEKKKKKSRKWRPWGTSWAAIQKSTFWECCVSGEAGDAAAFLWLWRRQLERKENRENRENKAELHGQQDFGVMVQCWHRHSFYCSRWILNGAVLEKRFFNSCISTLSLSFRVQRGSELCSQWHRDKSRGRQSNRRRFPQKAGRAGDSHHIQHL